MYRSCLLAILLIIMCFLSLQETALACGESVERAGPWPATTTALIRGKAISVSDNGRNAVLQVSSYAGPPGTTAPSIVRLPPTENRVPRGTKCADPSVRFAPGGEYIVFLSGLPPHLKLADPSGLTAYPVLAGGKVEGLELPGDHFVQDFASKYQYEVTTPKPDTQTEWQAETSYRWWWVPVFAVMLGVIVFLFRKKGRPG